MRAQLINQSDQCVDHALEGLVLLSQGALRRMGRVVMRTDVDRAKVAVISLGGSGHEPSHAGMVGKGMLTAAVAGEIFASPPPKDILTAIVEVTGEDAGALLIVKNYTGDIVNARIAKEKAESEYNLRIEIVVCADDCATKDSEGTGARGLAGTLFVHKIAGALAEARATLDEIVRAAQSVTTRIRTMGLSFSTCVLPSSDKSSSRAVPLGTAELGLGIHGESGVRHLPVPPTSAEAAKILVDYTLTGLEKTDRVAIIINNLGGLSVLEILIFARDVLKTIEDYAISIDYVISGSLMTSLDSAGVSLSLLHQPNERELLALRSTTNALGWGGSSGVALPRSSISTQEINLAKPKRIKSMEQSRLSPQLSADWITRLKRASRMMQNAEMIQELNDLDSKSGDGDTGTSISRSCRFVEEQLETSPPQSMYELLQLALMTCENMGGSLGGILTRFVQGMLDHVGATSTWTQVFDKGVAALDANNAAKVGDRSFVDALVPAIRQLNLEEAARAAREGANSTASLVGRVGRACYIPKEKYLSFNDAGAEAVARYLESMLQ